MPARVLSSLMGGRDILSVRKVIYSGEGEVRGGERQETCFGRHERGAVIELLSAFIKIR